MFRHLLPPLLVLAFVITGLSQGAEPNNSDEAHKKLEKEAVEFLRETSIDVNSMRTMENRISFNAELASLMWFHDDAEAKAMYGGVVSDFKQLLARFDSEINAAATPGDDDMNSPGGFFGGYGRSTVERKFRIAMAVRQQIAMSLAEHAPDLAYNFFYDSLTLISNPQFRKETEQSDKTFEFQLMKQIADSNAAKAAEYGKESIKSGLDINHLALLQKIYAKDPDKGVEFGASILSRLKSDKSAVSSPAFYGNLLSFGSANLEASKKPGGKPPVYPVGDLRDIAELYAQVLLVADDKEQAYDALSAADQIDKYAPGRGAQIRAKYRNTKNANAVYTSGLSTAANSYAYGSANSNMRTDPNSSFAAAQREREERQKQEKQMMDDVKSLANKSLPKEERDKIIEQSRKIISQTPGKDKKIVALSMLAAQVAHAGDKELADEIMRDAERMVNSQPKNYQDFLYSWMLASGYAEADPEKAFPLLESTILRANETISAFVKVAEFIDVNEEIIADGEVQVGMFGGSMIRGITGELGLADSTIKSLVKADFVKTRNLTNTFDRTEIRILAKMMVLRAVLDTRTKKSIAGDQPDEVGMQYGPPPAPARARR